VCYWNTSRLSTQVTNSIGTSVTVVTARRLSLYLGGPLVVPVLNQAPTLNLLIVAPGTVSLYE